MNHWGPSAGACLQCLGGGDCLKDLLLVVDDWLLLVTDVEHETLVGDVVSTRPGYW